MTQTADIPAAPNGAVHHRNAQEWWESLGCVPMNRIVFDPLPGTATEADVTRLDDHEDRVCELIDGTLVEKTMGFNESMIAARIIHFLSLFVIPRKLGWVTAPDGMMRILPDRIRIPDVAFISVDRTPDGRAPRGAVPQIAPDLAVEILSASNTRAEMSIKLREYFTAGTRLVWYVDPETNSVDVYTGPEEFRHLTTTDTLDGADVLPGFQTPVAALFDLA